MTTSRTTWLTLVGPDPTGEHRFLACRDGLYLHPAKSTDLWSYLSPENLVAKGFVAVEASEVPPSLRKQAAARRKKVVDPRVEQLLESLRLGLPE